MQEIFLLSFQCQGFNRWMGGRGLGRAKLRRGKRWHVGNSGMPTQRALAAQTGGKAPVDCPNGSQIRLTLEILVHVDIVVIDDFQ